MDGNGGIRISLGVVATALGLLVQFGGLVYWLATEHAAQLELSHRIDAGAARIDKEVAVLKSTIDQRNAAQDAALARLDEGGSRKVGLMDERLLSLVRRVEVLERLLEEQHKRDEVTRSIAQQAYEFSRDTNLRLNPDYKPKLQQFPPLTWPPSPQSQSIGPEGGLIVAPPGGGVPSIIAPDIKSRQ